MPGGPTPRGCSSWAMGKAGVDSQDCASLHRRLTLSGRGSMGGSGVRRAELELTVKGPGPKVHCCGS